jgi:alkaline phosphatase
LPILVALVQLAGPLAAHAAPAVSIRLPERFRVLTDQQFDARIEATGLADLDATIQVLLDGVDITAELPAPEVTTDNDAAPADLDKAWTFRKLSIPAAPTASVATSSRFVEVVVTSGEQVANATITIGVQDFDLVGQKNIVLYIGDAMGTAYRDAGRLVAKSTGQRFREGFFDELQAMDQMPVTGMVMTYALDRVVPDSANTATAWASGSKTIDGALGVFPDNNDFRFDPANVQGTKQFALDNPRIETLWEYLKRLHGYRTGIVTTADVTDATPAGQGAHTVTRGLAFDIARQFIDGVFTSGPTFDVIMGGGRERFNARTAANSGDTRDLIAEMQAAGYAFVDTRTALTSLVSDPTGPQKVLGLFRTGNMNVAYDKLGLVRPGGEPEPNFAGFTDQPFLDEMTQQAIGALARGGAPFILMVEGASIDKQSHPNLAVGTLWDTIELDKAIRVGREFARVRSEAREDGVLDTLVLVSADHDQSMHILGVTDTNVTGAVTSTKSNEVYPASAPATVGGANPGEVDGFPDYVDANGDGYPENQNRLQLAVGFRTGNHTGSSVPITAEGPGALLFVGYFDQTDIFFKMAKVVSTDTSALDQALTVKQQFPTIDPNY